MEGIRLDGPEGEHVRLQEYTDWAPGARQLLLTSADPVELVRLAALLETEVVCLPGAGWSLVATDDATHEDLIIAALLLAERNRPVLVLTVDEVLTAVVVRGSTLELAHRWGSGAAPEDVGQLAGTFASRGARSDPDLTAAVATALAAPAGPGSAAALLDALGHTGLALPAARTLDLAPEAGGPGALRAEPGARVLTPPVGMVDAMRQTRPGLANRSLGWHWLCAALLLVLGPLWVVRVVGLLFGQLHGVQWVQLLASTLSLPVCIASARYLWARHRERGPR